MPADGAGFGAEDEMTIGREILSAVLFRIGVGIAILWVGQGIIPAQWAPVVILVCGGIDVLILWWLMETSANVLDPGKIPTPADPGKPPVVVPDPGKPPAPDPVVVPTYSITGKCSEFGGPSDHQSGDPSEGLALVNSESQLPWFFTTASGGLLRRLDPRKHYIATRWDYSKTPKWFLLASKCTVTAAKTGKSFSDVQPVDWGPNAHTGRVADLSPGLMSALGITTDDTVTVTVPLPGASKPETPASPTTGLTPQTWPTQAECPEFYGNPDALGWEASNLLDVSCPWVLDMDGTKVHSIKIHRKCAASLGRILDYVWEECGKDQAKIEALHYHLYSGSFNNRNIRGSSQKSMHAYGCALDLDDRENQQGSSKSLFTSDSLIVRAFEAESWVWGGRWGGSTRDAMHFQAALVR